MNTAKRFLTQLTAVTLAICVLFLSSCAPKKIDVEEYPGAVPAVEADTEIKTEEKTIPGDDEEKAVSMTDKDFEDFIAIPDPFEKNGKFQFCPDAIPECYARQYREKPEIIYVAKEILKAVYSGKTVVELPPEYELKNYDYMTAISIAQASCPLADACSIWPYEEDMLHYSITYFPKEELVFTENGEIDNDNSTFEFLTEDEALIMINSFTDYIQTLIDNNVTKDDSDMEKAEKIYEALVKEISYRERAPWEDNNYYVSLEELAESLSSQTTMVEDILNEKATTQTRIALLYQYILTQLNIECLSVTSSGLYTNQGIERLDSEMGMNGRNYWNVVVVDGKAYNCDLAYEMLTYEYDKSMSADCLPQMIYFGMSDSTRAQTFTISSRDSLFLYNTDLDLEYGNAPKGLVPECKEDYKK
ncbi:MAG: hypothetical protein J5522_10170 [Lachnospiraceae bacterium]|nr:hypothetical protein [Lachnospiraceae bacterium]